ncbi:MAG: hypothetical protein R6U27_15595 [Desulfobacterales bacterium]
MPLLERVQSTTQSLVTPFKMGKQASLFIHAAARYYRVVMGMEIK